MFFLGIFARPRRLVPELINLFPSCKESTAFAYEILAGQVELEFSAALGTKACQTEFYLVITHKRFSNGVPYFKALMLYTVFVKFSPEGSVDVDGNEITISIKSAPERGKANAELVRKLADHFNVTPSNVRIVSGYTSRKKTVDIT